MQKVARFNLSGVSFEMEESAHAALFDYLEDVRTHFAAHPEYKATMHEVEKYMASLLLARLKADGEPLNKTDIEWLIAQVGDPKETRFSSSPTPLFDTRNTRRLFRDPAHGLIGGVCVGMGHFFSLDTRWVRILFVILSMLSSGVLTLVYVALCIGLPKSSTKHWSADIRRVFRDPKGSPLGRIVLLALMLFGGMSVLFLFIWWVYGLILQID